MKKTSLLTVYTDIGIPKNSVVIHPNDGFDLGLTNKTKSCALFLSARETGDFEKTPYVQGCIVLDNNCSSGTVNINDKIWKTIGKPQKAVLACKGNSVFFITDTR
jgi:hypothetical protein